MPLSFVATSRNDGHGGDLLGRMQQFVDALDAQCRRHDLDAELVLVEWNPPADKPPLAEALRWPEDGGPLGVRIVTVPPSLHNRLDNSDVLPLYQMIAKNVGVRRARGGFVAATNIDIVFSDGAMSALAGRLRQGVLYRADRHDVYPHPPAGAPIEEVLAACRRNTIRENRRDGTLLVDQGVFLPVYQSFRQVLAKWAMRRARRVAWRLVVQPLRWSGSKALRLPRFATGAARRTMRAPRWAGRLLRNLARAVTGLLHPGQERPRRPRGSRRRPLHAARGALRRLGTALKLGFMAVLLAPVYAWRELRQAWIDTHSLPHLHTNGCGDMTLLSAADWSRLRGYPEWPIFSWHLDSVLVHQAAASGTQTVELPAAAPVYHLEHAKGSGFTPDGEALLFGRLRHMKVPFLSSEDFSRIALDLYRSARKGGDLAWDQPGWGMEAVDLPETAPTRARWENARWSRTKATGAKGA